ncbi:MAG: hypothetical protein KBF88_16115 [Polyangiaceae bacterium]|nr:hypothetical protein [Polyangiaceae bacterium]
MSLVFGFSYEEKVSGIAHFLDDPLRERQMELSLRVKAANAFLLPKNKTLSLSGTVSLEGICTDASVEGTLVYKFEEKRVPYAFRFKGDDGRVYEFRAQKDFSVFSIPDYVTTLRGTLYDEELRELGRVILTSQLSVAAKGMFSSLKTSFTILGDSSSEAS